MANSDRDEELYQAMRDFALRVLKETGNLEELKILPKILELLMRRESGPSAALVAALQARRELPAEQESDINYIAQAISDRKLEVLKRIESRSQASDPQPDPPDT